MKKTTFYPFMLPFLVFLLLASCRAKKSTTYTEKVKDSTVRNIIFESRNLLEVSTLCDSLGYAKEFSQVIESGSGTTKVEVKDNKLVVEVKNDSIVYVDKWKEKTVTDTKEVIRERIPLWVWLYMVFVTILVLIGFKVIRFK